MDDNRMLGVKLFSIAMDPTPAEGRDVSAGGDDAAAAAAGGGRGATRARTRRRTTGGEQG
jgi:hypothetical protein